MPGRIKKDRNKFIDIVKGKIKANPKDYLKPSSVILPPKGSGRPIKIVFPSFDWPRVRYGPNFGGLAPGKGEIGDDLGPIAGNPSDGDKQAGESASPRIEVEFTEEEFLQILELILPNLEPKGERTIQSKREHLTTVGHTGPDSRIIKKRMYKKAIMRQMAAGEYDPDDRDSKIIPIDSDKKYRAFKMLPEPQNNAVLAIMRDISGSVGEEEQALISFFCFVVEIFLRREYDELETVYIVHHTESEELSDQESFLHAASYGGTFISSAHEHLVKIVEERFPPDEWNIYPIYFGDGMNWERDNEKVLTLLKQHIIPFSNQYSYGEIDIYRSWYSPGAEGFSRPGYYGRLLDDNFKNHPKVIYTALKDQDGVWEALTLFFGKYHAQQKNKE